MDFIAVKVYVFKNESTVEGLPSAMTIRLYRQTFFNESCGLSLSMPHAVANQTFSMRKPIVEIGLASKRPCMPVVYVELVKSCTLEKAPNACAMLKMEVDTSSYRDDVRNEKGQGYVEKSWYRFGSVIL